MELTILGFNSALPTANSNPTAQVLNICERYFLIDCGEATQMQLRKARLKFSKINNIFISHLHGDHVFGLVGLISSFNLLGRDKPLTIFGPKGIKEFIEHQLKFANSYNSFSLIFKELESKESELIFEDDKVEVHTIPLNHRVYCNGYLFKEKPKERRLNMAAIKEYPEIEVCDYQNLKSGKDFALENGKIVENEQLTFSSDKPMSYAFCSDTQYLGKPISVLNEVDVMYHEATFLQKDHEIAVRTGHSTAQEAAQFAKDSKAKFLIIGHFSNRYKTYKELLDEAQKEFKNTVLPEQLKTYYFKDILNTQLNETV